MNILIVGNGFDLSHYLPTKYEHFISVMQKIEAWSNTSEDMHFDDLFDKEDSFFQKTKSIYRTNQISIPSSDVNELNKKLAENIWYKFFSHHLNQIDTWIDFELEFSQALDLVAIFSEKAEKIYRVYEKVEQRVTSRIPKEEIKYVMFRQNTIKKLCCLGILQQSQDPGKNTGAIINQKYYRNKNTDLDIDFNLIIRDLDSHLNDFISIFNWYLQQIIQKLEPKNTFKIKRKDFEFDDLLVFSFNYTSTFSHFYSSIAKIEYVHGVAGNDLVLGIPDIKNEFLKKFKNYSFTKYHQKLLKDTDYLFLEENPKIKNMLASQSLGQRNIKIHIWGHSLAESDENYIHEIFSLNRKGCVECHVVVYFYDNDAPILLNNLLAILEKDKVEQWMKKGWLKFEKNPEIDFGIPEDVAVV